MAPVSTAQQHESFVRWCWVAAAAVLALAVVATGPFDPAVRHQVSRTAVLTAGAVAAIACVWCVGRSAGRRRLAWGALALGHVVGLCGTLYASQAGSPTIGDMAYQAALLLGVVGLWLFPSVRLHGRQLLRLLLDSTVVGGSVLYIAMFAVTLRPDTWAQAPTPAWYNLPVLDVVLATLAVFVMARSDKAERTPLVLLGSGVVLYAVSDVMAVLLTAAEIGWMGGFVGSVTTALAARHPSVSDSPAGTRSGDGTPVPGTVVSFCVVVAAALVRVFQSARELPLAANVLWVSVLVAIAVRQVLVVVDNESLRHALERRVAERTAQLRALAAERERTLESVAEGIYGVDSRGRVTFVNAAAAHMLGVAADDLVGRPAHATFHAPDEDGTPDTPDTCYVTEALRDGVTVTAEEDVYVRADGTKVPVEVTAGPLRDETGIRGAVVAFRDITERREVERLKDEFVSVVSHELRTPLTSIRGALGLLDSKALDGAPERRARLLEIALDSSERLARLVNDILDTERLEAGRARLELEERDLDALVADAVEQVTVLADQAHVALRPVPSHLRVSADGERIVRALTNLLGNAVRFSSTGDTVTVTAAPVDDLVEVHVDDQGRGIPPDKLEAIFRRFEQVDASDTRERGGSGLGLAIARTIVDQHGGSLWAVSGGEGQGSSFRFTLRRAPSDRADVPPGLQPVSPTG